MAILYCSDGTPFQVDDEDVERVSAIRWDANRKRNTTYVHNPESRTRLHRLLLGAEQGQVVDPRNGDGLDNRRANLRLATWQQNAHNACIHRDSTSGVKGVCWDKSRGDWLVRVQVCGVRRLVGHFDSLAEAAAAARAAQSELHGEFANHG